MPTTRRFLDWNRPVLELAAERLLAGTTPPVLDLGHLLVVVPTKNAGRRLREMLAHLAARDGRAICPPQVVPPEFLLSLISGPDDGRAASPEEALLAWVTVLQKIHLDDFPALFPVPPANRDFQWALGTARSLNDLRNTLAEGGLSIAGNCELLAESLEEAARWEDLARLEAEFVATLRQNDREDLLTRRQANRQSPQLPAGITAIRVIACPDPIPLAIEVLEHLGEQLPLEVWVHAPGSLADAFDSWGRPIPEAWAQRRIEFPGGELPVHVLPGPDAQAALVAGAIPDGDTPSAVVSIGILDDEVTGPLRRLLEKDGRPPFDPGGTPLRSEGVLHLLRVLRELLEKKGIEAFAMLLRCPDFDAYLAKTLPQWNAVEALRVLDSSRRKHLFADLPSLQGWFARPGGNTASSLTGALEVTGQFLARLGQQPLTTSLLDGLRDLLGSRPSSADPRPARVQQTVSEAMVPLLEAVEGPIGTSLKLRASDLFALLLATLEQETLYEERRPGSIELLGWLELHWDEAPHLMVTGFNEGFVPESLTGDIYLPEGLRKRLAELTRFPTNESRLARDTYLFEALLQCRRDGGRVDFCLGRHSRGGDPLRPSRLLFLCADEDLPDRVRTLFRDAPLPRGNLAWTPGFELQPFPGNPPPYAPKTLSVTAFREYLSSPFTFYLRRVEGMETVPDDPQELDALGFGNFCHEVLRQFGAHPEARESSDAAQIRKFFRDRVDELAVKTFGFHPPLPVRIQLDGIRARLDQAAEVQARSRADGWRIIKSEYQLDNPPFVLKGVELHARIDRIDEHEKTGAVRVLDYKTSDKAVKPETAHWTKVTKGTKLDWVPEYARFSIDSKNFRWKDLQLPLYRLMLKSEYGDAIECAYFTLPKAVEETAILPFTELGPSECTHAQNCAEGIIKDIRERRFWPAPSPKAKDEFHRLHLGAPLKTFNLAPMNSPRPVHEKPAE